jgi:hypothetical protein
MSPNLKASLAKGNSTFVYHVDGLQKYFRKAGLHQSACQSHRVLDNLVNMSHPNATMRERGRKGNWETHRVFDGCWSVEWITSVSFFFWDRVLQTEPQSNFQQLATTGKEPCEGFRSRSHFNLLHVSFRSSSCLLYLISISTSSSLHLPFIFPSPSLHICRTAQFECLLRIFARWFEPSTSLINECKLVRSINISCWDT